MAIINNRTLRTFIFSLGFLSLALGIIGAFLPLLPTTPFVLLAAWCFLKSSEKTHQWLYQQPALGKILRDWEQYRAIALRTKVIAISMMALSLLFTWVKVTEFLWLKIAVTALLVAVSIFIATRNSK